MTKNNTTEKSVTELTFNDVLSVYSGKDGKCCCGCAGKHSYNSKHRAEGAKTRGYAVDDDDVNDKMIARVLTLVRKQVIESGSEHVTIGEHHVSTVIGERLYIVYVRPSLHYALTATSRASIAQNVSLRVLALVESGRVDVVGALRIVCGAEVVDTMIDTLYNELRAKAVN